MAITANHLCIDLNSKGALKLKMNRSTGSRQLLEFTSSSSRPDKNKLFKAEPGSQGLSNRRLTIDPQLIERMNHNLLNFNHKLSSMISPKTKLALPPLSRLETVASEIVPEFSARSGKSQAHETIKLSKMFKLNKKIEIPKKLKSQLKVKSNLTDKSTEMKNSKREKQLRFRDEKNPGQSSAPLLQTVDSAQPRKGFSTAFSHRPSQLAPPFLGISQNNLRTRSKLGPTSSSRKSHKTETEDKENDELENCNSVINNLPRISQIIRLSRRVSTIPPVDFIRNSKSPTELAEIWRNTSVIDPCFIKSKIILSEHETAISKMIDNRIVENYESMKTLGNEICQKVHSSVIKITEPVKQEYHQRRKVTVDKIWNLIKFIISCKIPAELIFQFPSRPYQNPKSVEFIEAAKLGKNDRVSEMLVKVSPLLVYEYDHFRLTALHWAAIRNYPSCGEVLLDNNSFTNALDSYGRSPLYYAIKNQNSILVYMMLVKHASPWSPKHTNYFELANKNEQIIYFLKRFRLLDLMLMFRKASDREQFRQYYIASKVKRPY